MQILKSFLIAATVLFFYQCARAQVPGINQVTLTFDQPPSSFTVDKASFKYNKDFALSLHLDDGNQDIYTHAFPLLEGGEYTYNGNTYTSPGYDYTDGCGHAISFKMAAAIPSFSGYNMSDPHDPNSGSDWVKWPDLIQMYDSGWAVYNHGYTDSQTTDYYCSVCRNHSYVKLKMMDAVEGGPEMKCMSIPFGDINYNPVAYQQGYDLLMWIHSYGVPSLDVTTITNWEQFGMGLSMMEDQTSLPIYVDNMAGASVCGAHHWGCAFSHMITSWNFPFEDFKSFIIYTANTYGSSGLDNIWMATAEEVYDYLLINPLITVNTQLTGTQLTLTFSGNLPVDLRWYALSLIVESDASITNVSVDGGFNNTYHISGGQALINLNWNGFVAVPPAQNAETYVAIAEQTQVQCDVDIAVDYTLILEPGPTQNHYKGRLCTIPNVELPEGFCEYTVVPESKTSCSLKLEPNPFSNQLHIILNLDKDTQVELGLYDNSGSKVQMIYNDRLTKGSHNLTWDCKHRKGQRIKPGVYYCVLKTPDGTYTQAVVKLP